MNNIITEFKAELLSAAKAADITDIELFYMASKSDEVSVYQGAVENFQSSNQGGIGVRGLYNGVMGYYYSEKVELGAIPTIINAVKENAQLIDSEDKEFIFDGSDSYAEVDVYNPEIKELTTTQKIDLALEMERTALAYDSRINGVSNSIIASGETDTYLANSKGMELSEKSNYFMAYVELIAEEGESTKEKGELWMGTDIKAFNPTEVAKKAAKKAVEALNGSAVPSFNGRVILKNEVLADILDCFVGCFFAENVQKGFSLLKDKLNTQVAASKVTIADEPLLNGGYATTAFDSEGVASYNKCVVKDGVLNTYLYNLKSAYKDGVASTGNGFKSSFKGTVATAATNFYIKPMTTDFEELVKQLGDGLIITDAAGLHSGANAITGDFSLAASGFLVENGKVVRPVEQITMASNFFDLLMAVEELGNDLYFSSSAVGAPSAIVKNISISGE
jgi:PmbA protein